MPHGSRTRRPGKCTVLVASAAAPHDATVEPRTRKAARKRARPRFYPAPPPRPAVTPPPQAISPWVRLRSFHRHPFIYQKMVDGADPAAAPGDIVQVYDRDGALCGRGLYNPRSQIVLRMLTFDQTPVDEAFWRGRLRRAIDLRRMLAIEADTDAYRLVHAEGDELSGLIVERFADVLVFELFSLGMFRQVERLAAILREELGPPPPGRTGRGASPGWRWHVRVDPRIASIEGIADSDLRRLAAKGSGTVVVREHGVRYRVDFAGGQKTGFFCDQRENRRRLARLCRGARVLDVCCYSGGFALCARVLGEAREVTGVDVDEQAVRLARHNANLNAARVTFVHADAFGYLRQMTENGQSYDVVVLDPPKLAPSRDELAQALRKYFDLNRLAMQVTRPEGLLLTCSCSGLVSPAAFMDVVQRAARAAGRRLQVFEQTSAGPDHPVSPECPESAYLKALWCRVGPGG